MGQGVTRQLSVSDKEPSEVDRGQSEFNTSRAASYPGYSSKNMPHSAPAADFLRSAGCPPILTTKTSVPDGLYADSSSQQGRYTPTPPLSARRTAGRQLSVPSQRAADRTRGGSIVFRPAAGTRAMVDYSHNVVSASEAQQRREEEYLDRTLAAAAEEAAAAPTGELECLASGFLSLADFVYVAETLKGLSSLLLCDNDRAARCIGATHQRGAEPALLNGHQSPTSASATTSPTRGANTVGALISDTAATPEMAALSWAAMRDALLAQRDARLRSLSGASQATLSRQQSTSDRSATATTTTEQHTAVFDSSITTRTSEAQAWAAEAEDGEGAMTVAKAARRTSENASVGTATPAETGLSDPAEPLDIRSANPSVRGTDATPLSATLGSLPRIMKIPDSAAPAATASAAAQSAQANSAPLAGEAVRPLSMDDLIAITTQDEVLDLFLMSMGKRMRGLTKKLRVLPPFAALRYCIVTILRSAVAVAAKADPTGAGAGESKAAASTRAQQNMFAEEAEHKRDEEATGPRPLAVGGGEAEWVYAETVVERPQNAAERKAAEARKVALSAMGDDVQRLFADTQGLLLKALTTFANAMPLGINSRINNNYLLPTEAILSPVVGCGVHTRRRTEFFVSMADRVKMLHGHQSFQSPEALLLGISQLSNLASQMLSSFAVGAVLAFATRWRELHESGVSSTDELVDVMEKYAASYCAGFDVLCNEAFPALRKQYPNVFVVSSFVISDEAGGRPPIVTVAMSALMKLIFLFAGGLESIRADDRRLMAQALKEERRRRKLERQASLETGASNTSHASTNGASAASSAQAPAHGDDITAGGGAVPWRRSPDFVPHPPATHHERAVSLPFDSREGSVTTGTTHDRRRGTLTSSLPSTSRRSPAGSLSHCFSNVDDATAMTDDVALATALHVRSASLLVVIGATIASDPLSQHAPTTHDAARLALAVSRMWRVLFQAAGLLPHGRACPQDMSKWLPLFPMYAVNTEAKQALLRVYAKTAHLGPLCLGPLQRGAVLHSAAGMVEELVQASREAHASAATTPSTKGVHQPALAHAPSIELGTSERSPATDDGTASRASTAYTSKERNSISRSIAHAAAATVSHRLLPLFNTSARKAANQSGLRSASRVEPGDLRPEQACELRKDLYDLAAEQVASDFFPAVSLAKDARAVPLPGGVAAFGGERLEDRTPAALQRVASLQDKLAVVVVWRKSAASTAGGGGAGTRRESRAGRSSMAASAVEKGNNNNNNNNGSGAAAAAAVACPIRVGDELTFRWTPPSEEVTEESSSPLSTATAPAPQRHAVLAVLKTTSSANCVVLVLDSPNYLSSYALATPATTAAATGRARGAAGAAETTTTTTAAAPAPASRKRPSSVHGTSPKRNGGRRQSTVSLQSVGLINLEEAAAGAPAIAEMLLYRRQTPMLVRDGATLCAWTNPYYLTEAGAESAEGRRRSSQQRQQQQHRRSSCTTWYSPAHTAAMPTLLGWLLGQSPSNDVVLSLPLPPLAFRILGLALHLEEEVADVRLDAADVSLRSPDYTREELAQHVLEGLRDSLRESLTVSHAASDDAHFSGSPAVARRQYQRLKSQLSDTLVSQSWSVHRSSTAARAFWAAVLEGMRQTPLTQTPIFAQCCSRTVREVLCGPYDHPALDFTFRGSFLLLTNLNAPLNAYRNYIRKCVKEVLDEELSISEKRLLLRFITGHTLLTSAPHTEVICIEVQHGFSSTAGASPTKDGASAPVTRAAVDATLRLLPQGRPSHNMLVVPSYFDALLLGTYREAGLGADFAWLARRLSGPDATAAGAVDVTKDAIALSESDYQFAWAGLGLSQQETLKRRFRELLVHRLRAALYASVAIHEDTTEQAWELAGKLGLDADPTFDAAATQRGEAAVGQNGAFMRRPDGTLVFIDDASGGAGQAELGEWTERPFDDDGDDDGTFSTSMEGGMEDAAALLDNSAFGLFGEAPSTEERLSLQERRLSSVRASLRSDMLTAGTGPSQHATEEDFEGEGADLNGYHTAASFCFAGDDDSTVLAAAALLLAGENEDGDGAAPKVDAKRALAKAAEAPKTLPAVADVVTKASGEDVRANFAGKSDGDSSASGSKSSNQAALAPMAVAPPRRSSIVTQGMSTLLQHARTSYPGAATTSPSANTNATLATSRKVSPTATTGSRPARRPSYALGVPLPLAAGNAGAASHGSSRNTSTGISNPLMAEVDLEIQELFPDDDIRAV